jgi:hypothetical protein
VENGRQKQQNPQIGGLVVEEEERGEDLFVCFIVPFIS